MSWMWPYGRDHPPPPWAGKAVAAGAVVAVGAGYIIYRYGFAESTEDEDAGKAEAGPSSKSAVDTGPSAIGPSGKRAPTSTSRVSFQEPEAKVTCPKCSAKLVDGKCPACSAVDGVNE